jgi:DNA topoisomerase-6 subunit B
MQAGQKLSRHIRRESKEAHLERKIAHIEQFGPILIEYLGKITGAKESRKKKAEEGLKKLLGRDAQAAEKDLSEAELRLQALRDKQAKAGLLYSAAGALSDEEGDEEAEIVEIEVTDDDATTKKTTTKISKVKLEAGTAKAAVSKTVQKAPIKTATQKAATAREAVAAATTAKSATTTTKSK